MNKTIAVLLLGLLAAWSACGGARAGDQAQEPAPATQEDPTTQAEGAQPSPWMDDAGASTGGDDPGPMNPANQPPQPDPEPDELDTTEDGAGDESDLDPGDDLGDDAGDEDEAGDEGWSDEDWEDDE